MIPTKKKKVRRPVEPVAITPVEYGGLQKACDFFNSELFNGALVDVFIVYQRRAHSRGYFAPDRFSARVGNSAVMNWLPRQFHRPH